MATNTPTVNYFSRTQCVYAHINLVTSEIFYIGIGKFSRALTKRARNPFWHNIVNKYDYDILILEENLTWEEACELEIKYIKQIGRRDLGLGPLVNMTNGGDGVIGYSHTEETKALIRLKQKGRGLGRKLSPETIEKVQLKKRGMKYGPCSDERKKNISLGNLGKKRTLEAKQKMSEAKKGKVSNRKGKIGTRRRVLQFNLKDQLLKEWESIKDVATFYNKSQDGVYACINKRQLTAFGFKWQYKIID